MEVPVNIEEVKKMILESQKQIENMFGDKSDVKNALRDLLAVQKMMQPKYSKRITINENKATATLGQKNNVMIVFDDAVEGEKYYNSLTPIPDVGNHNE